MIRIEDLSKTCVPHTRGAARLLVPVDVPLTIGPQKCVAFTGASGAQKSTLMRGICPNDSRWIVVGGLLLLGAGPCAVIAGILHDTVVSARVCGGKVDVAAFAPKAL